MIKFYSFLICFILLANSVVAQDCTTPGQTPSTAFPVCGTSTFHQTNVPICGIHNLYVPGCTGRSNAGYADKNPFWYKFTCFTSGTLGFLIKPKASGDDYDWQLYDITGHDPNDVFTNNSLIITGNWAGTFGNTGASASGVSFIQCASDPADSKNSFSTMPQLIKGHTYLLLVSHFTDSQSGYDLSFGGGTAVITDTTMPHLKKVEANCGGDVLSLNLNKHIKCNSIANDGSDFYVTPSGTAVKNSIGINCSSAFDTDSLELQLAQSLTPGNYTLHIQQGSDGNTLLDYCDNAVPTTDTLNFTVLLKQPTPMDSLSPVHCAPQKLTLVFRKPILCSSIAPDGSDFVVNGTYPVSVSGVSGNCSSATTKEITITLSQALQQKGDFNIVLQRGSDGNTLLDECEEETPAGSSISFHVKDTVNAAFSYAIHYGCTYDTINFAHPAQNEVNSWQWNLDDNLQSTQQNPQGVYTVFNTKHISLTVSNGFCNDSSATTVLLDNYLKADFTVDPDICPAEPVPFTDNAVGKIVQYNWSFGDGGTAQTASPTHIFAQPFRETMYQVQYTVTDTFGCQNTIQKPVHVYSSCNIAVPNAFTPNGDGRNDYLYPLNAVKAQQLEFKIYNRWGQLIYATGNWKQGWDGTFKGQPQPAGVYIWFLHYIDGITHQHVERKGTAMLIR